MKLNFVLIPLFGWLNINQFLISRRGAGGDYRNGRRPSVFPSGTFRVRYVSPIPLKYFLSIWLKCSPGRGDVQNPCRNCAASRSKARTRVPCLTFRVGCLSYTPWRIFCIFGSNVQQVGLMCRTHAAAALLQGHTWRSKART